MKTNYLHRSINSTLNVLIAMSRMTGQILIGAMAVNIVVGVISRYAFNNPLAFTDEFTGYFLVGISVIAANWVLRENGHIRVDFITKMLNAKIQAWLLILTDLATIFCVGFIVYQMSLMVALSIASNTTSTTVLRIPIGFVQILIPIGFGLMLVELVNTTIASFKAAIALKDVKKPKVNNEVQISDW